MLELYDYSFKYLSPRNTSSSYLLLRIAVLKSLRHRFVKHFRNLILSELLELSRCMRLSVTGSKANVGDSLKLQLRYCTHLKVFQHGFWRISSEKIWS